MRVATASLLGQPGPYQVIYKPSSKVYGFFNLLGGILESKAKGTFIASQVRSFHSDF